MEQGICKELTTHFVDPVCQEDEQCLIVKRSEDRRVYVLEVKTGAPLLLARAISDSSKFDIFVAGGGDPPVALGPAFDVQATSSDLSAWLGRYSVSCGGIVSLSRVATLHSLLVLAGQLSHGQVAILHSY